MRSIKLVGADVSLTAGDIGRESFSYEDKSNTELICFNCKFYNSQDSTCFLFVELNASFPDIFGLDINVSEYSNCKINK